MGQRPDRDDPGDVYASPEEYDREQLERVLGPRPPGSPPARSDRARAPEPARPQWAAPAPHEHPVPPGAPEHAPTAVASLVLGILGLTLLPVIASVIAVVLGHSARSAARREPHRYTASLGTAGLVLGYVGLGFLAIPLLFLLLVFMLPLAL